VAACDEFDLHRHAVLGAWIMPAQRESTGRSCCLRETRRYVPSVSGLFLPRRTISQRGNPCEWLCCAQVRPGTGMPGSESPNLFNNRATPMRFNSVCTAVLLVAALSSPAIAQYATGFESLTASAAGTTLTGQDSFYLPVAGSVDLKAFTYAGSGMPANPDGGSVFVAGTSAGTTFARAQRDITYGTGTWRLGFDILGKYTGVLPTAQNLGSFSIQPAASQNFIALATWTDVNTAQNWNANYVWFDAAGVQLQEVVPNPAFQSLSVNHWYRWETDVNLTTNQILEVRLTDLATNTTATHVPVGRYLLGGMTPAPAPTGFRMFAGGAMGNTVAFDNVSIGTFTPPCSSLSVGGSGQPGSTLIFNLTGAAPQAPAMLLLGVLEGTTVQQIGVLGTLTLGLAHPFTPSMMGLTDATGAATLSINVPPGNLPLVTKFAQAMTVVFTPPSHGPPSLAFCTSDVESFVYGGLSVN
jgi:hypothetical protein